MKALSSLLSLFAVLALVLAPVLANEPRVGVAKVTICQNGMAGEIWVDGDGQPVEASGHDCLDCCLSPMGAVGRISPLSEILPQSPVTYTQAGRQVSPPKRSDLAQARAPPAGIV